MTKSVTATIGWTKSDMPRYSSFDGWQAGEAQHEETVTFEVPDDLGAEDVCWVLLTATNAPFVTGPASNALEAIQDTGYRGQGAHFSLSKGDTVTIEGVRHAFTGYAVEVVDREASV